MKIKQRCEDPIFPRGGGIFSMIFVSVVTDLCSGIIGGVIIPKICRYFGEDDCDRCEPPIKGPRS